MSIRDSVKILQVKACGTKSCSLQQQISNESTQYSEGETCKTGSSFLSSCVNLFKSLVGIGILSLPIAFSKSGWLGGIVFLPICGLAMLYLNTEMMKIADRKHSQAKNIAEFSYEIAGDTFGSITGFSLFIAQIGVCISYVIFFLDLFQQSLCYVVQSDSYLCESRIPSLLLCLAILIPCSFFRHLDSLQKWSLSANLLIIGSLFVISLHFAFHLADNGLPALTSIKAATLGDSIGIFIFTFEGVGICFDVRHSMQEPKRFPAVLNLVVVILTVLYCCFGLLGYIAFGALTADIILFNFDKSVIAIFVIKILYCISLLLSVPLQIFPCVKLIDDKILQLMQDKEAQGHQQFEEVVEQEDSRSHTYISRFSQFEEHYVADNSKTSNQIIESWEYIKYSYGSRILLLMIIFGMATCIDKMSVFINLLGSVCGTLLSYTIPFIICYLEDIHMPLHKSFINWTILVITSTFAGIGTYSSLVALVNNINENV